MFALVPKVLEVKNGPDSAGEMTTLKVVLTVLKMTQFKVVLTVLEMTKGPTRNQQKCS